MRWGISGAPVPPHRTYAADFNRACARVPGGFSPILAYAAAMNEDAAMDPRIISPDGGYGIMQITPAASGVPLPADWFVPESNVFVAVSKILLPAVLFWVGQGLSGDDLVRCAFATYNSGGWAWKGHVLFGDVDHYTTNRYGARGLANLKELESE